MGQGWTQADKYKSSTEISYHMNILNIDQMAPAFALGALVGYYIHWRQTRRWHNEQTKELLKLRRELTRYDSDDIDAKSDIIING